MKVYKNIECLIHIKHKKFLMFILIEALHIELNNFLAILYLEAINALLKLEQCLLKNCY